MGFLKWLKNVLFGGGEEERFKSFEKEIYIERVSYRGAGKKEVSRPRRNVRASEKIPPGGDRKLLNELGIPILAGNPDIARRLGVSTGELCWLAFPKRFDTVDHYREFHIPKLNGGERRILAPKKKLKAAQRWILKNILTAERVRGLVHENVHGFRRGKSVATNARPHVGAEVVVHLDLTDFFETITLPRVRGIFRKLGYSHVAATTLAILCTVYIGRVDETKTGSRKQVLPQGAPTSPAITNLVCNKLDRRLAGLARRYGVKYTRYADDITFSGGKSFCNALRRFLPTVRRIIREERFTINEKKVHVARKGARQSVTGIVVNQQMNIPRSERRRYRAILHQLRKIPPGTEKPKKLNAHLSGVAAYLSMINPEAGRKMHEEVKSVFN